MQIKEDNKTVALSTSKLNYMDPVGFLSLSLSYKGHKKLILARVWCFLWCFVENYGRVV